MLNNTIKTNLQKTIIAALFDSKRKDLYNKRHNICLKNRELVLEPYKQYMDKLPKDLLNHSSYVKIRLSKEHSELYPQISAHTVILDSALPNIAYSPNNNSGNYTIVPELLEEYVNINTDILNLEKECSKIRNYLETVLRNINTIKQCKEQLPALFYKPIESTIKSLEESENRLKELRAKNKAKKSTEISIEPPNDIKEILTNIILEN